MILTNQKLHKVASGEGLGEGKASWGQMLHTNERICHQFKVLEHHAGKE